jgi:two-component system CheB/CheR fusion protein
MALTDQIVRERGVPVASYKRGCLERRIASRMRARGADDCVAYAEVLRGDPAEYDALLDALVINVTHRYRDQDVWESVAERVLPDLWASAAPTLHTWVAGCASGEEAYTVASLWHQFVEHTDPGAAMKCARWRSPRWRIRRSCSGGWHGSTCARLCARATR